VTEAEWLACTDPLKMLEFLRGKGSNRKLRLFAVACCRVVWGRLTDERGRRAVEVAERYADGGVPEGERNRTWGETRGFVGDDFCGHCCVADEARGLLRNVLARTSCPRATQAALLRDIIGNPFRPVTVSRAWQTPQVVPLAQAAYEQRELPAGTLDVARLAVLADALEDAGCDQADLLGHLRGPGPHVRGCWAVDLLLGKS
jgi:hypothetical protein